MFETFIFSKLKNSELSLVDFNSEIFATIYAKELKLLVTLPLRPDHPRGQIHSLCPKLRLSSDATALGAP